MNMTEIGNLIDVLKINYMSFASDVEKQIKLWYPYLKELSYLSARQAVTEYMLKNDFPPSISQIVQLTQKYELRSKASGSIESASIVFSRRIKEYETSLKKGDSKMWNSYVQRVNVICSGFEIEPPANEFELARATLLNKIAEAFKNEKEV